MREVSSPIYQLVKVEGPSFPTLRASQKKVPIVSHLGVSKYSGTPKSSILTGFSIINHPFWGTTIFGNIHFQPEKIQPTCYYRPRGTQNNRPEDLPFVESPRREKLVCALRMVRNQEQGCQTLGRALALIFCIENTNKTNPYKDTYFC